jgi:hypothetical protein
VRGQELVNGIDVAQAMSRAVKAVEEEFKPIFGKRAAICVNVATKDWAFGSNIGHPRRSRAAHTHLAESLRASADEAEDTP